MMSDNNKKNIDYELEAHDRRQSKIIDHLSSINFPMHPKFCFDYDMSMTIKAELDRIINEAKHLKDEILKSDKIRKSNATKMD